MKISFASISELGPRAVNEDFIDCWKADTGETIACIADGLGGMGGGDVASRLAVKEFRYNLQSSLIDSQTMASAALAAHQAIRYAQSEGEASRMATTLTAISLSEKGIVGVHCGDSRAVIARGKGIKRLTKDHSEGQRLFEAGKLSKEELSLYPRKHILESALGDREEPRIDKIQFDLLPGDRVILSTDGVHNIVFLKKMQSLCVSSKTPRMLAESVAKEVAAYGANDNYSLIALFVDSVL